VGKVIKKGGVGVTISSQSGKRMKQLTKEEDELLATTDTEELLKLDILQPENITDTLHAYQMAKRCNEKRVMFEACRWAERGARVSSISRRTYNEWKRSIITGSDFLIDGGATASYYHGKLKPET